MIVTAYAFPRPAVSLDGVAYSSIDDARAAARFVQDQAIRRVSEASPVRVSRVLAHGDPVGVLVAATADADLLVVGRRSSRLRRLMTGSVSKGCVSHAACPVVVVRADVPVGGGLSGAVIPGIGSAHVRRSPGMGMLEGDPPYARRPRRFEVRRNLRRTQRGGLADA